MSAMTQPKVVPSTPAIHLGADDGEAFRLGPLEIVVKENGSGTRMNLAVAEFRGDAFRIPPHVHTEHDETIYVLEGRMGVNLGDRTFTATAGTSSSPRVTSSTSARWPPLRRRGCRRPT